MIVEFSVKNFRSIKELQTISFVATGLKSAEKHAEVDVNNIAEVDNMRLFKTLGIYGANASGKSNVIKALQYFIFAIRNEPTSTSNLNALTDTFLYQDILNRGETFFQIVMIIGEVKYRYGFTIRKNRKTDNTINGKESTEIITNEWLYGKKDKNMRVLFQRENKQVVSNNLKNKERIPSNLPYQHSLYLTHAAAFDEEGECQLIRKYFQLRCTLNFQLSHEPFRPTSIFVLENNGKKDFLKILSEFGLIYSDIFLEKEENFNLNQTFKQNKIWLIKKYIDDKGVDQARSLNLEYNESSGTQKLFDLTGLLLNIFKFPTSVLIALDEIDANFHPSLLIKLIGLFNNPKINKSNSQLLFTSHDTNLMSPAIMRRDQFYFTEKKEDESTRLYSLADLKGIRNDADFAKQYLAGYYGAVPLLEEYTLETPENVEQ
ncbi:MAG: AAA15 family ATPase/GTPase [Saprospiraceae bacterium]|jgi:AAA15 family ATPase/GTPase